MRRHSSLPLCPWPLPALVFAAMLMVAAPAIAAPETTILSGPNGPTSEMTAEFDFTSDTGVAFQCNLDNAGFGNCVPPFATATLPEGPHTFSVRAIDGAAVADPTPASRAWVIDTTLPIVNIFGAPINVSAVSSSTPTLQFEILPDATGIAASACRVYEAAPPNTLVASSLPGVPCLSSFHVTSPLADGAYLFEVTATDGAGNTTMSQQFAFTVDTVAPSATIAVPPSPVSTNDGTPSFTFSVDPGGTAVSTSCRIYVPFTTPPAAVPCTSPYTSPTQLVDGQYTFDVIARDAAGNAGSATHLFQVDTVPPTVIVIAGPTGTTNTATPTFKFTRSPDAVASVCAIDNNAFVPCNPDPQSYTASPLSSGPHTFFVKASDAAGNEATATRSFTVDLGPPETAILNGPPSRTNQAVASFDFGSELGATFACRLDLGPFGACSGTTEAVGTQQIGHHTTGTLDEGFHTFEVRATDAAGNVDPTPASLTWFVDLTPPVAVIATKPSDPSNQATPPFAFTSEPGATYECQLDGAGFAPCPDTYVPASPLGSGSHTIEVRAIDSVGNAQVAPTQYTWMVDVTPPDTFLVQLGPVPSADVVNFVLTSDEPGTFQCNLDDTGFVPCDPSFVTPSLSDGTHTLIARAIDTAGNIDPTPASQTWLVDTVPPDTFILEAPPTISHEAIATFQFDATEQPVTFECSLDGAAFEACSNPVITPALADGPHTFAVRARDAANHADETPAVHAWTIALGASLCDGGPFVCKAPGSTKLTIRNSTKDTADKLEFRWSLGDATTVAELGDPSVDTEYAVCVWDTTGGTASLVMAMQAPPAGNCAGKPCWRSLHGGTAFRYKDFGLLPDGVQQMTVRSGPLGKANVSVKGRGLALPDPPMPFTQQPSIVVQVVNGLGTCWGADYVVAPRTNTAAKLLVEEKP